MNMRWPKIRVSRQHRATVVRTDRHMMTASGRNVDLFMLDEHGSWVRVASTTRAPSPRPRLTADAWALPIGILGAAALYVIAFFICAIGPDRW